MRSSIGVDAMDEGGWAAEAKHHAPDLEVLESVQRRVLWLATAIVHHANHRSGDGSGLKVGGHQASSASMVSLMTALWFDSLGAEDAVSVKPHASPVLHAINYLLGGLDASYLSTLRAFGGLQSYPSRTKDPDAVDFSTGSVGIGATAPVWAALARRYIGTHYPQSAGGRQISLLGDAELDEGAVWEAVVDPLVSKLGELLWIVDVNRQSLDRVVPDIAAGRLAGMFRAAGWQVITIKYGSRLTALFEQTGGGELRSRIDKMGNEEYQHLLRAGLELREQLIGSGRGRTALAKLVGELDDHSLRRAVRDLGGHDLAKLIEGFKAVSREQPTVIFAYTIKGWCLPIEGHPGNHSSLLTEMQLAMLARELGTDIEDPWARFRPESAEAKLCAEVAERLRRSPLEPEAPPAVPASLNRSYTGRVSTQQALGRVLLDLNRAAPEAAARVVTVSPDVATSTNLGGWINKVGVWSPSDRRDWFSDDREVMLHWTEKQAGQHIALGIAETNLVGLLGELGATWSRLGRPLMPVGTIYDPFVSRCLEPWSFGIYAGGQSILVGTPSGVTLAPEGGAHQSIITPSIGLEQPQCVAWEPAFAQDFEWTMLAALGQLGRAGGTSSYFRLSTRAIEQSLAEVPADRTALEVRRRQVLAGGYKIGNAGATPPICLVGMGAVMPEVLAAASELGRLLGEAPAVVCVTSADLLFRAVQSRRGLDGEDSWILSDLFGSNPTPLVTVLDGHPHTLSFLGGVNQGAITCLGVKSFGQSGDLSDVYRYHGLDTDTIVGAAFDLLEEAGSA
jgi:pyruvate dehydrogenase E1 component